MGDALDDTVSATAILDRLRHRSQVISMRGERCRLREKRPAGLIAPRGQEAE